ncbi:MAG: Sec-independent protein translocase protein TatA [Thermoleophilia bacterium]|nr:Sec-independent protein translocase protein TatA [Thermoleophilia bacterium]
MGIHWQELIVILLIVLVLFGPKRLPEIGSSLGKGIKGFRESLTGLGGNDTPSAASITAAQGTEQSKAAATTAPVATPLPVEVVDPTTDSARDTDAAR